MQSKISTLRILIYQNIVDNALIDYLKANNLTVDLSTENTIKTKLRNGSFDLCILDVFESSENPLDLVHFIRGLDTRVPVIFLSAVWKLPFKVEAFKAGIDDYIEKPYSMQELICRIKAVLKRCGIKTRKIEPQYNIGPYVFNTKDQTITLEGLEQKITNKEAEILALLCAYKDEVLPKEVLLKNIWQDDNFFIKRSLDVYICNLRSRFKEHSNIKINTLRGIGYTLIIDE